MESPATPTHDTYTSSSDYLLTRDSSRATMPPGTPRSGSGGPWPDWTSGLGSLRLGRRWPINARFREWLKTLTFGHCLTVQSSGLSGAVQVCKKQSGREVRFRQPFTMVGWFVLAHGRCLQKSLISF